MSSNRRLVAIMFTDMVGSTAATQRDEASALVLLHEHEELLRPLFIAYQGREVKSMGDGFLVEFESALKATQCAVEIQRQIHERNAKKGAAPIQLRIGIHLGDVEQRGSDIFGDAVNIASRIQPVAEPGGICVSNAVQEQVRNKISDRLEKLPPTVLKGLQVAMDVYRVILPWDAAVPLSGGSPRTRLAVLPLANISPDPKDEYFADGLTEELITVLSKIRELRVIARTSVNSYKSATRSISQIGSELGVGSVLEGSVRKSGNRLRITLQLIDVVTQEHAWAESYDRELDDVFAIQGEIAEKTAGALRLELLGSERRSIRKKPTSDLPAYNLYLRGIHASHGTSYETFAEAIEFLEEAIQKDPNFVAACTALANVYIGLAGETLAPGKAFARARELMAKSLQLDPDSSDAHLVRANLAAQDDLNWAVAEMEYKRAISLNPSGEQAHFWYAFLLRALQRYDEAIEEIRIATELDPLWPLLGYVLGDTYIASGDLKAGLAVAEGLRDRDPQNGEAHAFLCAIYLRSGQMDKARKELEMAVEPAALSAQVSRAALWARLGKPEEARRYVREFLDPAQTRYVGPWWLAGLYSCLGEKEAALEVLERDEKEGSKGGLWFHYQDTAFDPIRGDPRFRSLVKRLNLPVDEAGTAPQSGMKR